MKDLSKIQAKAVLIGALVDIGSSVVSNFIVLNIMAIILASQGVPSTEIDARILQSPTFLASSLIIGFGFTFLGGFVAANLAKVRKVLHSSLVGSIGVALGLVLLFLYGTGSIPLWYNLTAFILTIPVAAMGGYTAKGNVDQPAV